MVKKGMTASPGTVSWVCPYCDKTAESLREIQKHITDSTDGKHEGVSGESPDEDIIAVDEDGTEVDVFEAADVVRPQDSVLEQRSKRKQVVYSWVANDQTEDVDAFIAVTQADRDYIVQILGQIRRGEIGREYWAEDMDQELLSVLRERLEEYYEAHPKNEDDREKSGDKEPEFSAKTIILNTFDLAGEDLNRADACEALKNAGVYDASYEYFRRTYKEAIDGEYDVGGFVDEQVQSVVAPVLWDASLIASDGRAIPDDMDELMDSAYAETHQEETEYREPTGTGSVSPSRTSELQGELTSEESNRGGGKGVSVAGVQALRERVDLLKRQVEFESDDTSSPEYRKARFIADEVLDGLDSLLEDVEE